MITGTRFSSERHAERSRSSAASTLAPSRALRQSARRAFWARSTSADLQDLQVGLVGARVDVHTDDTLGALQMVPAAGFEPATFCSGGRRSIP